MQNNFGLKKFLIENKLTPHSQKTEALDKYGMPKTPERQRAKNEPEDVLNLRQPGNFVTNDPKSYKKIVNKEDDWNYFMNAYRNKGPKGPLPEEEMNEDYFYEGEEEAEKQYADLLKQADQAEMQRSGDRGAADYMLNAIWDEINKLKAQFPNLGK